MCWISKKKKILKKIGKRREIIILKKPCTESKKTEHFRCDAAAAAFLWLHYELRGDSIDRLGQAQGGCPTHLQSSSTHTGPISPGLGLPTRITNALTVRLSLTKLNVFINRAHKQREREGEGEGKGEQPVLCPYTYNRKLIINTHYYERKKNINSFSVGWICC